MTAIIVEFIIGFFLLLGAVASVIGAVGLVRFPDVYNRMHSTTKNVSLGTICILIAGTIFFSILEGLTLKLLLVIPFLFWTASAGAYTIARAAHRTGTPLTGSSIRDDLMGKKGIVQERQ